MKLDDSFVINRYKNKERLKRYISKAEEGLCTEEQKLIQEYLNKEDKILVVGCGTGREIFGLLKLGFNNVYGLDISEDMIQEAKKLLSNVKFFISNIIDFKIREKFDALLYFSNILDQIPEERNRELAILKAKELLHKGGILILTTHSCFVSKNILELIKNCVLFSLFKLKIITQNPFEYIDTKNFIYASYSNPFKIKKILLKNDFSLLEINSKKFLLLNKKPLIRYIFDEPIYYVAKVK